MSTPGGGQEKDTFYFQKLFERAPLGYQSLDPDGRLIQVNAAWCRLFGYQAEEVLGRPFSDFLPSAEVDDFHRRFANIRDVGEVHGVEFNIRRKDGAQLLISFEGRAIYDSDGELERTYAILIDLTNQRRRELRLQSVMSQTVKALSRALEKRDPYTAGHQERVAVIAVRISQALGLDATQQQGIQMAAIIHDIGKIHIPLEILTHPGALSGLEKAFIRAHPVIGHEIVKDIDFPWPIAEMILQHHERLDGSGYPNGLIGDEILLGARILAVADVYESMTTMRPYRAALGPELALNEIRAGSGRIYDPDVIDAAIGLFNH